MTEKPLAFSNPAANTIRGAFGFALLSVSPAIYKAVCEPDAAGPSGLETPPRPFVLRLRSLNDRVVLPGQTFSFALHLFAEDENIAVALQQGVARLASEGLGPARSQCELLSVETEQRTLSLEPAKVDVSEIKICFQSPTELKHGGQLMLEPDFAPLFRRVQQRIETLGSLYACVEPSPHLAALTRQAEQVTRTATAIQQIALSRRSSRTGHEHPLGGFVGSATYQGAMAEFLPCLRVAEWTGIGRQTTWGKGEITVEIP